VELQWQQMCTLLPNTTLFRSRAIDDCRVDLRQTVVIEAILLQPARLEVLDGDLAVRGELAHELGALGLRKVDRDGALVAVGGERSEEHTSELQSRENIVCRLL